MNCFNTSFLCLLLSSFFIQNHLARAITIYGDDNRKNISEITDPRIQELAKSTAVMVRDSKLSSGGRGVLLNGLDHPTYALKSYCSDNHCGSNPPAVCGPETFGNFRSEPAVGTCTGTLIAPRLILTAAHCTLASFDQDTFIYTNGIFQTHWVFGYDSASVVNHHTASVPVENVYQSIAVVAEFGDSTDFAIVLLDRPVPRKPVPVSRTNILPNGTEIFSLGFPLGLPLKWTGSGTIAGTTAYSGPENNFFQTDLDLQNGNSGGPIFNAKTMELIGVDVRGFDSYSLSADRISCIQQTVFSKDKYAPGGVLQPSYLEEGIYSGNIAARLKTFELKQVQVDYHWSATALKTCPLKMSFEMNEKIINPDAWLKACKITAPDGTHLTYTCDGSLSLATLDRFFGFSARRNFPRCFTGENLSFKVDGKPVATHLHQGENGDPNDPSFLSIRDEQIRF